MSTAEQTTPLVARMRGFGTTIFAEMSALAAATGAVNLGQGFPDFDGPPEMLEAAQQAIRDGVNQYPPGPGTPELRRAVAAHQQRFYGLAYDPDTEVVVTAGATEAVTAAVLALCEAGDEVVVLDPLYDSYAASVALAGAVVRPVALRPGPDGRFGFDPDEARRGVRPPDPPAAAQHPAQPDRHGPRPRRARPARRAVRGARRRGRHRRGLRAPGPRRRARPADDLPRHGGADPADQLGAARRSRARAGRSAGRAGRRRWSAR